MLRIRDFSNTMQNEGIYKAFAYRRSLMRSTLHGPGCECLLQCADGDQV